MSSSAWALLQYDWCLYEKGRLGHRHPEKRTFEDTGEDGHLKPRKAALEETSPRYLDLGLLASKTGRKSISVVYAGVLYASPRKLAQWGAGTRGGRRGPGQSPLPSPQALRSSHLSTFRRPKHFMSSHLPRENQLFKMEPLISPELKVREKPDLNKCAMNARDTHLQLLCHVLNTRQAGGPLWTPPLGEPPGHRARTL